MMKPRPHTPESQREAARLVCVAADPQAAIAAVESRGGRASTYRYVADRLVEGMTLERALDYLDAGVASETVRVWEGLRT